MILIVSRNAEMIENYSIHDLTADTGTYKTTPP